VTERTAATEYRFGPPPASTFEVEPTAEQVAFFDENGFLAVDRLTTDEEIDWLVPIFDAAFEDVDAGEIGGKEGDSPKIGYQTMVPEMRFPELMQTTFWRNAKRFASRLLHVDAGRLSGWSHMIRKPPRIGGQLPWHQDEAYWDERFAYKAMGTWVPLDVATVESGCMHFLPGSHVRPIASHRHIDDDPMVQGLFAEDVDTSSAVPVELQPGGATFHHCRTMHHTPPNVSARARRAWATEFQLEPVPLPEDQIPSKPWLDEQRAAVAKLAGGRS